MNGNTVIGPDTNIAFTSGNTGVWSYTPSSTGSHRFDNFSVTVLGGGFHTKTKGLAMIRARTRAVVSTPPTNTTWRVYYYANGKPIAMREMPAGNSTGTLYYLHSDHLGSTSVTTCGNTACGTVGSVFSRQRYYPYGEIRPGGTGTQPTTIGYTGQRRDDMGLMYFRARYYSSALGRFASADSIVPGRATRRRSTAMPSCSITRSSMLTPVAMNHVRLVLVLIVKVGHGTRPDSRIPLSGAIEHCWADPDAFHNCAAMITIPSIFRWICL